MKQELPQAQGQVQAQEQLLAQAHGQVHAKEHGPAEARPCKALPEFPNSKDCKLSERLCVFDFTYPR